ncbi:MAG: hypothetical protein R3B99_37900, partial [Polyangiales bacterium]
MSGERHGGATKWIWLVAALVLLGAIGVLSVLVPIEWRWPQLRWVLFVPALAAVLFALEMHRQERATSRFGNASTLAALTVGRANGWRLVRGSLLVVGLAFLVLGLAGPRYGSRTRILHKRGVDVVIALDFSKSMLARG